MICISITAKDLKTFVADAAASFRTRFCKGLGKKQHLREVGISSILPSCRAVTSESSVFSWFGIDMTSKTMYSHWILSVRAVGLVLSVRSCPIFDKNVQAATAAVVQICNTYDTTIRGENIRDAQSYSSIPVLHSALCRFCLGSGATCYNLTDA